MQTAPDLSGAVLFVVLLGLQASHLNTSPLRSSFKNTANEIIGKKIKRLREEKGMTQQGLADIVGGDRQYINKVET